MAKRRRFRGILYLVLVGENGPDDPDDLGSPWRCLRGVALCVDELQAELVAAGWPYSEIWAIPPDEGAPLRSFLAGEGPNPLKRVGVPEIRCFPENIVTETAAQAQVSKPVVRRAIEEGRNERYRATRCGPERDRRRGLASGGADRVGVDRIASWLTGAKAGGCVHIGATRGGAGSVQTL